MDKAIDTVIDILVDYPVDTRLWKKGPT